MKTQIPKLRGFQDFLPSDMIALQQIIDTARKVCESYGFRPQMTPALEAKSLLLGEESETGKQIYLLKDKEGNELGLRFDLTMPLARIIALHARELRFPYKRYQYGRVWRYDKPRPGRFREFGQFDCDTVGALTPLADSEICALMHDVMKALGFENFLIRINSRKILTGLSQKLGLSEEQAKQLFRELDKLDKQGWKKIRKNLETGMLEEEKRPLGFQLSPKEIQLVEEYLSLSAEIPLEQAEEGTRNIPTFHSNQEILSRLEKFFAGNLAGEKGLEELHQILSFLEQSGKPLQHFQIDTNIARGLDYYTGPVFETILPDHPGMGAVYSGGRYDFLLGRYIDFTSFFKEFQEYREKWKDPLTGAPIIPATGASLGVDRLFAIMKELGLFSPKKTLTQVLIVTMDPNLLGECHKLAEELRRAGVIAELYTGDSRSIKHQLRYADRLGIPLAVLYGEYEHRDQVVAVKDLRLPREDQTKQRPVPKSEFVSFVLTLLQREGKHESQTS